MDSLPECEAPSIKFQDGMARISGLVVSSTDAVDLLRRMEGGEVQSLVDSLLATIAKVAEGATTAQLIMKEFREQIQKELTETMEATNREISGGLEKFMAETLKELRLKDEGLAEKVDASSKELKKVIEERASERLYRKLEEMQERFALKEKEKEVKGRTTLNLNSRDVAPTLSSVSLLVVDPSSRFSLTPPQPISAC